MPCLRRQKFCRSRFLTKINKNLRNFKSAKPSYFLVFNPQLFFLKHTHCQQCVSQIISLFLTLVLNELSGNYPIFKQIELCIKVRFILFLIRTVQSSQKVSVVNTRKIQKYVMEILCGKYQMGIKAKGTGALMKININIKKRR